jgi:hypothetical protein
MVDAIHGYLPLLIIGLMALQDCLLQHAPCLLVNEFGSLTSQSLPNGMLISLYLKNALLRAILFEYPTFQAILKLLEAKPDLDSFFDSLKLSI